MKDDNIIRFDVDHLRRQMSEVNASQSQLAPRIGISPTRLSRYLTAGEMPLSYLNAIYKELGKGGFSKDVRHVNTSERLAVDGGSITERINDEGFCLSEAAKMLGVNPSTFCGWLKMDKLPADIVEPLAELLDIEPYEVTSQEPEQLEIPFAEEPKVKGRLYTVAEFKEFINLLADNMMDFLADYIDQLGEV